MEMSNDYRNIAEILMKCKKGTKLYSPIFGNCRLLRVVKGHYMDYDETIEVEVDFNCTKVHSFDYCGRYAQNNNRLGECLLFPSKENRNWDTFIPDKIKTKGKICQK